jgi:hypothetical protein
MDATSTVFAARGSQKFLPANYSDPANVELVATQKGDDRALAVNGGLLWAIVPQRVSLGVAFASGPKFHFQTTTTTGAANGRPGLVAAYDPANPFKVPDRYSAGLSIRSTPAVSHNWRVSVETDRVTYSELMSNFSQVSLPADSPQAGYVTRNHYIDDATEVRGGGAYEYSLSQSANALRPTRLALRGGLFFDPQHQIYYQPDNPQNGYPTPLDAVLFPKAKDDLHRSVGIGVEFTHVLFDLAADFADKGNTFIVSSVFKFCSDTKSTWFWRAC